MVNQDGQANGQAQGGQPQGNNDPNVGGQQPNSVLNAGSEGQQGQEGQQPTGNILNAGDNVDGQGDGSGQQQGAPENYDTFKLGDDLKMDDKALEGFTVVAKELNLTQDQAQKLVDYQSAIVKENHDFRLQESENVIESWKQETIEKLGENLKPQQDIAKKMLGTRPELAKVLDETGLINHPEIFKMIVDFGRSTSEDPFVDGNNSGGTNTIPRERRMFPSMSGK